MQVTVAWMQEWFERFNHDYFGGGLPLPRLALSMSRTRLGFMACKRRVRKGRTEYYDYSIHISNYYDRSERQYQNVLLHEMIHESIAYSGLKDTSAHGVIFRGMMDNLNRKYGWEMTVMTSARHTAVAGGIPQDRTYLVLAIALHTGERMLTVVNPRYARQLNRQLPTIVAMSEHGWYTSKDAYFFSFPQVRSLRGRRVSAVEYERKKREMTPFKF
jgi:hypothetical protein